MAANQQSLVATKITKVDVCKPDRRYEHGLLVTFGKGLTVFYDAEWLFDNREVCGNFTLDEDEIDA